jgi:hypothetical protein
MIQMTKFSVAATTPNRVCHGAPDDGDALLKFQTEVSNAGARRSWFLRFG